MASKLQNTEYKNWIKCTLGLQLVGDAIRPQIETRIERFHREYIQRLKHSDKRHGYKSSNNPYASSEESDDSDQHDLLPVMIKWDEKNKKYEMKCNNCAKCEKAFDIIIKSFARKPNNFKATNWGNVEFQTIFNTPWALAQVLIPIGGNFCNTASKTDPLSLVRVLQNCCLFKHSKDSESWKKANQIGKYRNQLMHSVTNMITTEETNKMFISLEEFLKSTDESLEEAISELNEIPEKDMDIKLMKTALDFKIRELQNEIFTMIESMDEEDIRRCKDNLELIRKCHRDLLEEENLISLEKLRHDLENMKVRVIAMRDNKPAVKNIVKVFREEVSQILRAVRVSVNEGTRRHETEKKVLCFPVLVFIVIIRILGMGGVWFAVAIFVALGFLYSDSLMQYLRINPVQNSFCENISRLQDIVETEQKVIERKMTVLRRDLTDLLEDSGQVIRDELTRRGLRVPRMKNKNIMCLAQSLKENTMIEKRRRWLNICTIVYVVLLFLVGTWDFRMTLALFVYVIVFALCISHSKYGLSQTEDDEHSVNIRKDDCKAYFVHQKQLLLAKHVSIGQYVKDKVNNLRIQTRETFAFSREVERRIVYQRNEDELHYDFEGYSKHLRKRFRTVLQELMLTTAIRAIKRRYGQEKRNQLKLLNAMNRIQGPLDRQNAGQNIRVQFAEKNMMLKRDSAILNNAVFVFIAVVFIFGTRGLEMAIVLGFSLLCLYADKII